MQPNAMDGAPPLALENEWCLYYDVAVPRERSTDSAEWASQQSKIGTFSTIGGFWSFFNNLAAPSRLPLEATYSCFQSHIKPAWEDVHNTEGGEIRIFFNKTAVTGVDSAWSSLLLSAIGETLLEGEAQVCGLTVSRKKHKCKIAVWISRSDAESRQALEEAMRRAVGPEVLAKLGLVLEWTSHRQLLDKEKLKDGPPAPGAAAPLAHLRPASGGHPAIVVPVGGSPKPRNLKVHRPPSFADDSVAH